jgi:hypothetical protein
MPTQGYYRGVPWERIMDVGPSGGEWDGHPMLVVWREDYQENIIAFLWNKGADQAYNATCARGPEDEHYYDVAFHTVPGFVPEPICGPDWQLRGGFDSVYVKRSRRWMHENCAKGAGHVERQG